MVNKTGGKKHKKYKKNRDNGQQKKLVLKDKDQEYALLLERKGGPIMSLLLYDDRTVMGVLRGKLRKRLWMGPGDILLVAKRGFQDNKVDIIDKYSDEQVRKLIKKKHITRSFVQGGKKDKKDEDDGLLYDDESDNTEDDIPAQQNAEKIEEFNDWLESI